MSEYDQMMIARLFGPSASLGGTGGTVLRPGSVEIHIDGVLVARAKTLGDAIRAAQLALSVVARWTAAA